MTGRRRLLLGLALLALVLAAAAAYVAVRRAALAGAALRAVLEARGLAPVSFQVARVAPDELLLRDLRVGPPDAPDLSADRVEARWSWSALGARRLDALDVEGLRVHGALAEGGARFGVLDALRPAPAAEGAPATAAPIVLPVRELTLADARLELETPRGALEASLDGSMRAAPDGALTGQLALAIAHPEATARGTLELSGPLDDLGGSLALTLRDAREPPRLAPLELTGSFSGAPADLRFALTASGAGGALHAELRGEAEPAAGRARAELRLAPLLFAADGLQPRALAPALAAAPPLAELTQVSGRIEAHGTATLADGTPRIALELALRDLGFVHPLARVEGIHAVLSLRGPPLHMPKAQPLAVALVDPGVPLTDGLLTLRLRQDGRVALERARWRWAGGELRTGGLVLGPGGVSGQTALDVDGLDLARLFSLLALEGLSGSGRVDGRIPLALGEHALRVEHGDLHATGGGVIRYQPGARVRALVASRPHDVGLAVDAFSDFHFEVLRAELDGDLDGTMRIALHVRGTNPSFQDGRPVELNLGLDARLADLVRAGLASYRVPEEIEKRLRAFSEGAGAGGEP